VEPQSLEPSQLIVELGSRSGIAFRQIQAPHHQTMDCRFDVTAVRVVRVPPQPPADFHRLSAPGQDCDPVPAFLPMPMPP
jgi:hypothetical protein